MYKIGQGVDVHQLKNKIPLFIGGELIKHDKGSQGHSDGDVLIHAIVDSLLGAASLGDIGSHFPSSDSRYRGVSSLIFLEHATRLLGEKGWRIVNVAATIVAEKPRLAEFVPQMKLKIARAINLTQEDVSIKATTTDGLGYIGSGEGISCHAVVTIQRSG